MPQETIQTVVGYIAIAVPVTVAIANLARILLEWLKQRHTIQSAQVQQGHQITTHYLDRALDPTVPLAIRHQLLRFLATPDKSGSRLSLWAADELKRVGVIVAEVDRAVLTAKAEIQAAKTPGEVATAERKLADAVQAQNSLLTEPAAPPITAAALRAGLIKTKQLSGLSMKEADLSGAQLGYKDLRGSDFSGANLKGTRFQRCDLRTSVFTGADLKNTIFLESDLRGANLANTRINKTDFSQARLEGADLRAQGLETALLGATYDGSTLWPTGFDPVKAGAVLIGPNESRPQ